MHTHPAENTFPHKWDSGETETKLERAERD